MAISYEDVLAAHQNISGHIKNTELDLSKSASKILGCNTFFKFENEQLTGSFKIRGAFNKISHLNEEQKKNGVIACSAGNHGQSVAHAATLSGVTATIVMPEGAPMVKLAATKGYGANVILHGQTFDEATAHAIGLAESEGLALIHPFDDPLIIAGQGTIGIELHQKVSDFDSVIVPIGGGGLISGIATVIKHLSPSTKIFGVQSDQAPGMNELFHHGKVGKRHGRVKTIADGIAIKAPSQKMYDQYISRLVDDIVTVSDIELAQAIVLLLERAKSLAEGSGAAALAAALAGKVKLGEKTCIIISGGNADLNIISKVIDRGLQTKGRLAHISVIVDDVPGNLSRLTEILAAQGANVLEVHHHRTKTGVYLRETQIDFLVETESYDHVTEIEVEMKKMGIRMSK